jgi:hypothetical protein
MTAAFYRLRPCILPESRGYECGKGLIEEAADTIKGRGEHKIFLLSSYGFQDILR